MHASPQLRLTLVAPSGSGKSTAAQMLKQHFEQAGKRVEIIKLAAPLYALQRAFYETACQDLPDGAQDQHLLEYIASELRKLDRWSLVKNFERRLAQSPADVVINDDLRDDQTDWPYLRQRGFDVVKIVTDPGVRSVRLGKRGDISLVKKSALDLQMQRIRADYAVPNNGAFDVLEQRIKVLAEWLLDAGHTRVAA
ncbi:MAG: AAA family ATPase [Janthinobacterium lividum]